MQDKPDHGEDSYRGSNRLTGRRAVITGADSGIGRAVALAFAREGADVVLSYLESEETDAAEGRSGGHGQYIKVNLEKVQASQHIADGRSN